MRTLREWDRYLKKQEEAVKKSGKRKPESAVPRARIEEPDARTETSEPKSGAIIAVPAETTSHPSEHDAFRMPDIDEFVPAVSEPRPIPKAEEEESAVSEPRPIAKKETPGQTAQPELFGPAKKKRKATKSAVARPLKRRAPKSSAKQRLTSPRLMELPPSVREFFSSESDETAEKYYTKGFRESRHELVQRLLDPPLTLEETARVLSVCPTTVRRYTNKGVLKHYRTAGNQRRFRLSDVIAFVESHLLTQGQLTRDALTQGALTRRASTREPLTQELPTQEPRTQEGSAQGTPPKGPSHRRKSSGAVSAQGPPTRKTRARKTAAQKAAPRQKASIREVQAREARARETQAKRTPAKKMATQRKPGAKAQSRRKGSAAAKTRR